MQLVKFAHLYKISTRRDLRDKLIYFHYFEFAGMNKTGADEPGIRYILGSSLSRTDTRKAENLEKHEIILHTTAQGQQNGIMT